MGRRRRLAAGCCLVAGVGLIGHGLWIPAKACLAQVLLRRAWADSRGGGSPVPPWPWADTWPVARLRAPNHDVDDIVLAGGSGSTMAFGPGHVDGTAPPCAEGNCVLTGHRDTHFAFLEKVRPGDQLILESASRERLTYTVVDTAVVDQSATWVTAPCTGRVLTLVTCYPFRAPVPGGRQRWVVSAVAEPGSGS